jgi:TRAP-type mannitol/chloroaromatic compound transport system permease small subunit
MQSLLRLSRAMDAVSEWIGRVLIWALFATVIISTVNAVVRKLFSIGSNAWLELQWYLFAAVFLLGAGYTFLHNAHVRIDFISARLSARARNIIDIAGILLFLTPLAWLLLQLSWPLFVNAWQSGEMSQNAGGLIRWPVLALVPLGMALLLAQAASELVKRVAFLQGLIPDPLAHPEPPESQAVVTTGTAASRSNAGAAGDER